MLGAEGIFSASRIAPSNHGVLLLQKYPPPVVPVDFDPYHKFDKPGPAFKDHSAPSLLFFCFLKKESFHNINHKKTLTVGHQ
jgi:hypothetical protein